MAKKFNMKFAEVSAKTGDNIHETLDKFIFDVAKKYIVPVELKDIFMTFLLLLNENFDDDLLQDALEMLVLE